MNPKDQAAKSRVPMHLLPPIGQILGAIACGDGAKKYGPYNWREKPISYMEYLGAMQRHIARILDGEDLDPDSGYPHEGNIIATASIIADARECGTLIDDRPKLKGGAARVLTDSQKRHIEISGASILSNNGLKRIISEGYLCPVCHHKGVHEARECRAPGCLCPGGE